MDSDYIHKVPGMTVSDLPISEDVANGTIFEIDGELYDFRKKTLSWVKINVDPKWIIDETNIQDFEEFPVSIIFPKGFLSRTKYRVEVDCIVFGQYINKGYITDGATTPRVTWPAFPPIDRYWFASLTHDKYLTDGDGWSKANYHFNKVLKASKIKRLRRFLMHKTVQLNGLYKVYVHGEPK